MARRLKKRLRQRRRRQVQALLALSLVLTALHVELADQVLESSAGWGQAPPKLRRIEVSFVQELQPSEPPVLVAAAPPPPARPAVRAPAPQPAASAPEEPASAPEPVLAAASAPPPPDPAPAPVAAPAPAPVAMAQAPAASAPALSASAAAAAASAASAPAGFEWPPSTRLSYTLTGNYRGPVEGQARVEWVKVDARYQVRLELEIGPSFAPLMARRITSDGLVGPDGLEPQRYEEETKVAFRDARRFAIDFQADRLRLPSGRELPRPPGVQDTASQFVQLTWMFTTQPELLQPGRQVMLPLALPRYVDNWIYDVKERVTLATPFGAIETVFVKPRREPRPGVELTAEMWVAPSLQYLPVRILIRQDAETYVDLLVRELPRQAAR